MNDIPVSVGRALEDSGKRCAWCVVAWLLGASCVSCARRDDPVSPSNGHYVDPGPVNAVVPDRLQRLLAFESRDIVSDTGTLRVRYTLPVPKSWPGSDPFITPIDKLHHGNSSIVVEPSCGKLYCDPKDPNDAIDREFGLGRWKTTPRVVDSRDILRDERRDHQRVIVFKNHDRTHRGSGEDDSTTIVVAMWNKTALRHHRCTADLAAEIQEAVPAFEKACELMVVHE